jgi:hypothetical protein
LLEVLVIVLIVKWTSGAGNRIGSLVLVAESYEGFVAVDFYDFLFDGGFGLLLLGLLGLELLLGKFVEFAFWHFGHVLFALDSGLGGVLVHEGGVAGVEVGEGVFLAGVVGGVYGVGVGRLGGLLDRGFGLLGEGLLVLRLGGLDKVGGGEGLSILFLVGLVYFVRSSFESVVSILTLVYRFGRGL